MKKKLRWLIAVAGVLVVAVALREYLLYASLRDHIPGDYASTTFDGKRTLTIRFAPDGSHSWETDPSDLAKPAVVGRWRLSGRMLIVEEGSAASAPVSLPQVMREVFDQPLMSPSVIKYRVLSADDSGLLLLLGQDVTTGRDVTFKLNRAGTSP